ncbi:mRNA export factor GLE1-like [Atheta coriaria]|uniref:mRNA export factor GLE1-like n=1 Tax=Dalotia coriaria TaxID=877792 RepID=UPI0031F45D3E
MAEIVSCEPVQDLKRQAERCLECALEAEAEAQRKYRMAQGKSRSREEKQANPSNTCGPIKEMKGSTSTKCCDDSPRVPNPADINESFLQQEQRLKREKEQLAVQEQLRKVQQEQTKHQLEEQRKLLEEQAREIQRQRDLQKKQALLQQQEQQLKVQAQAQSARIQQLDAASVRLKQQQELSKDTVSVLTPRVQEKQTVAKKPLLSAAVARVTGVLRHSYPLGRNGKKCGTKPVKPK